MANNDLIYNAALSGATNGFEWGGDPNGFEYQQKRAGVLAFAAAIDIGIPPDPAMNGSKADLLTAAVIAVIENTLPSIQAAVQVIALYNALVGSLLPIATPPVPYVTAELNYTGAAPLLLTAIPADAPSGIYTVAMSVVVKAPATAGSVDSILAGVAPPTVVFTVPFTWNNITLSNALARFSTWTFPFINGTPTTITSTPTGITGTPLFDVYITAERLAPLPPA